MHRKYGNTGTNKACLDAKYSHNKSIMNTATEANSGYHPLLPNPPSGLPVDIIMSLSDEARHLYDNMFDYCTYAADPQYQRLHTYRNRIAALDNIRDRDALIEYFNHDPAIRWNGIPSEPYEYYKKDYYNS
jgi:hypothetical protein